MNEKAGQTAGINGDSNIHNEKVSEAWGRGGVRRAMDSRHLGRSLYQGGAGGSIVLAVSVFTLPYLNSPSLGFLLWTPSLLLLDSSSLDGSMSTTLSELPYALYFHFQANISLFTNALFIPPSPHIVLLLCGLPGSGKTTFAISLQNDAYKLIEALKCEFHLGDLSSSHFSVSCVHFDEYLTQSLLKNRGRFTPEVWHQSREEAIQSIENKLTLKNASSSSSSPAFPTCHHIIIIDDNMNYTSMRKPIFDMALQRTPFTFFSWPLICIH